MDRREKFREKLHPLYLPKYDKLCSLLPSYWQPYQGFRTFREQDALYAKGRILPGKIVTRARGGQSAHCWGAGTDWIIWDTNDKPIWIPASDPAWKEYLSAVEQVGLKSGVHFGDIDHNELSINCSWMSILSIYSKSGMEAALDAIGRAEV